MVKQTLPGVGLTAFWPLGDSTWKPDMDENLQILSTLVGRVVTSRTTTISGAPTAGDMFLVPSGASTRANEIALWGWNPVTEVESWVYIQPRKGWIFHISDEGLDVRWNGTGWVYAAIGSANMYDREVLFTGSPLASDIIYSRILGRNAIFYANFEGSLGFLGTNPAGIATFEIRADGVSIGTATADPDGSFSFTTENGSPIAVPAGTLIEVVSPPVVDATMADIELHLVAISDGGTYAPPSTTHVFLLAGQSNMVGRAADTASGVYPAGTLQYGHSDSAIKAATSPLDHWDEIAGDMGLARKFAIDYAAAHPDVTVVLVPRAKGGSSFSAGGWNKGDVYYASAVDSVNALMAANPSYTFKGVLWHQGENDANAAAAYTEALYAMMYHMRRDISAMGASTPFILGQIDTASVGYNATVNDTITRTTDVFSSTAVVAVEDLSLSADNVHWDGAELDVIGGRYRAALATATANIPVVAEAGAKHYLLGAHNPLMTTIDDTDGMTEVTPVGIVHGIGETTFSGQNAGALSTVPDSPAITQCYVVQVSSQNIIGGTLDTLGLGSGSSLYFGAGGALYYNGRGVGQLLVDNTLSIGQWVFIAVSESASGATVYSARIGGVGEVVYNVGTPRIVSPRNIAICAATYDSSGFIDPTAFSELILHPNQTLTVPEMQAIYARSTVRMAARGITLI